MSKNQSTEKAFNKWEPHKNEEPRERVQTFFRGHELDSGATLATEPVSLWFYSEFMVCPKLNDVPPFTF